jgi:hypothetical protein
MKGKYNVNTSHPLVTDLDTLEANITRLLNMIEVALDYVNKIVVSFRFLSSDVVLK